jgi:DNA polymerase III subunit delta
MASPPPSSAAALYLVCGEDDFGVKQRARQVFEQWRTELGGMDHETIDARVSNSGEAIKSLGRLRESLQTLPFFGSAKAVWLQDCNFLADDRASQAKDVTEMLAALAEELKTFRWENVRLLISAGKVDRRKSFYKTLEKLGTVELFAPLSLEDKEWTIKAEEAVLRALRARQKSILPEALADLVSAVGPNLRQLQNEAEKLVLYVGARAEIEPADVQAVVTRNKLARAFALGDALGNRDLPVALRCLDEEMWAMQFDRDKSEIGLLYGLIFKVRTLILVKELEREKWLRAEGRLDYASCKAALDRIPADRVPADRRFNPKAMHPNVLFKAIPQTRRYSLEELVRGMELLLECNRKLISSQLDEKLVLQQALVQIVRGESPPAGAAARAAAHR